MRFDRNAGGSVNYELNRAGNDDRGQAGYLFRLMGGDQQRRLMDNIAAAMAGVPEAILRRQIVRFAKADPACGAGVAERVGLTEEIPAE